MVGEREGYFFSPFFFRRVRYVVLIAVVVVTIVVSTARENAWKQTGHLLASKTLDRNSSRKGVRGLQTGLADGAAGEKATKKIKIDGQKYGPLSFWR